MCEEMILLRFFPGVLVLGIRRNARYSRTSQSENGLRVARQGLQALPGSRTPEPHGAVERARDHRGAVRRESRGVNPISVAPEDLQATPGADTPEPGTAVTSTGDHQGTARRKRREGHGISVHSDDLLAMP